MIRRRLNGEITRDSIRRLSSNSNISYFGQGSVARNIIDAVAREIEYVYDSIDMNMSQSKLVTASGAFLDLIAQQYGITRLPGTVSSVLAEDKAVRVYVTSGRLADRLGQVAGQGLIPSGTKIYNRDRSVSYTISNSVAYPLSATSVYVPVIPTDPSRGTGNNVAQGSLVSHDMGSGVFTENLVSIVGGTDPESDEELRLRISRTTGTSVPGSKTSVTQAAFSNAGVSDLKIFNAKHGAGSFEILVVPTSGNVSGSVLDYVRNAVNSVVPFGIRFTVRGPRPVGLSTIVQLDMKRGSLSGDRASAVSSANAAIRRYLAEIPMGGELIVNRMIVGILASNNSISDVRILQIGINCRPQAIANYQLQYDQVFELDRKVAEPILIT
jgi:uncharacterized phage protein gp47/JayE